MLTKEQRGSDKRYLSSSKRFDERAGQNTG